MASNGLLESLATAAPASGKGFAVTPGIVEPGLDSLKEGRVQVSIPSRPGFKPWARVLGLGGGPDRGLYWMPQAGDEVLLAFNQDDLTDVFVLGGVWNAKDRPPVSSPSDALNKRILRTGIAGAPGQDIEIDDAKQSITITTSTKQKVTIEPTKIELTNGAGTMKITMDNAGQSITLEAPTIELKATLKLKLSAASVDINGTGQTTIKGGLVQIN